MKRTLLLFAMGVLSVAGAQAQDALATLQSCANTSKVNVGRAAIQVGHVDALVKQAEALPGKTFFKEKQDVLEEVVIEVKDELSTLQSSLTTIQSKSEALSGLLEQIEGGAEEATPDKATSAQADSLEIANTSAEVITDARKSLAKMQQMMLTYLEANTINLTEKVNNATFNKDGNNSTTVTGWTNAGFKQNRRSVAYPTASGFGFTDFVEQWAAKAPLAGSGDINQTLANLPEGDYVLFADVFACNQANAGLQVSGAQIYANTDTMDVATSFGDSDGPVGHTVFAKVGEDGTLKIGFRYAGFDGNWLGWDNVNVLFAGDTTEYHRIVDAADLAAAIEEYNILKDSVFNLLKEEQDSLPLGKMALQLKYDELTGETDLTSLESVKRALDASSNGTGFPVALRQFYNTNKSWTALMADLNAAKALLADEALANGREELQDALTQVEGLMTQAKGEESDETAQNDIATASEGLKKAVSVFRVANASYAYPANVITNGDMNSMDGWTCINGGTANPALHINTSGDVTGFNKPFMECWVNSADAYGAENNAVQTVTTLPDGTPLPVGYYILKASVVAVRQNAVDTPVTGVELRMNDQKVAASTGNGISEVYTVGFETTTLGEPLTIGLYIDAATNANWIAWDNVELQYVGDKSQYEKDKAIAEVANDYNALKAKYEEVTALLASVNTEGASLSEVESALEDAETYLDEPEGVTRVELQNCLSDLTRAAASLMKSGIKPINGDFFDFTSEIVNNSFDVDAAGWKLEDESSMVLPGGSDCANWWFGSSGPSSLIQDVNQTLTSMPAGNYIMKVRAAIRLGGTYHTDEYTEEKIPTIARDYSVYANTDSALIHPFLYVDEEKGLTLESMLAMTNDYDYRHGNGTLINYMLKGDNDYYDTYVPFKLEEQGDIKIGFRVEIASKNGSMPFYDYFNLFYFGDQEITPNDFVNGIQAPATLAPAVSKRFAGVYNLNGQLLNRTGSTMGLAKGLYIVNGRKVVIK